MSWALVNANRTTIDQNELVYRLIYFYVHNFADNKCKKELHASDAIYFTLFGEKTRLAGQPKYIWFQLGKYSFLVVAAVTHKLNIILYSHSFQKWIEVSN